MIAEAREVKAIDDDSFLDWETRDEAFPFHKHIIAGKHVIQLTINRFMRRDNGACRNVPFRYC
jgi:hypothetical protein